MLANDLTLDKQDGTDVVYKLVKTDGTGSQRIDPTTTLSTPKLMTIRHSTSGKGADAVDRHLVSFSQTVAGSLAPRTTTVNVTIASPRDVAVTQQMIRDLIVNAIDFLSDGAIASQATTANIDAILRGES